MVIERTLKMLILIVLLWIEIRNIFEQFLLQSIYFFNYLCQITLFFAFFRYWGNLSSENAEKILSSEPNGSFLVRDSSDDHYIFSLTFKLNGIVRHVRIGRYYKLFFISFFRFGKTVEHFFLQSKTKENFLLAHVRNSNRVRLWNLLKMPSSIRGVVVTYFFFIEGLNMQACECN